MALRKKSSFGKWLLVIAVVAGVAVAVLIYQRRSKEEPLDFKTTSVKKGEITQSVTANGALNPVRTVTVGSQISGTITELKVDFNSKVQQGDVLARIDPATYERALARADADLANSQAGLELAKFNAKRAKQLFADRLISESEFQQAEVELLQAEANVKIRQASVDTAKVDLDRTTIYAPISGIVISRKVDAGQTVAASFNTPELFTIANDLTKMQIDTLVSEADVGGIEEGQKVSFIVDAFLGRKFNGRGNQVRYAPITNANVVNYTAVVEVDNRDLKLRPGMTANASIITAERTNILHVPNAALRFRPPESVVVASTNDAVARAAGTNAPAGMRPSGDMPVPPWFAERRRPTEEERKKYEDSLTPEQKEQYNQMRERMRARAAERDGERGG
ncbi:MAG TPA: efflux RND transporter periplasmic adaptor subunit, partial [Verrucomicrobiae bacterium]|nr:efflux RND transporter periplasmic adaptor subunit [Verrucomicrobiae bacterium]